MPSVASVPFGPSVPSVPSDRLTPPQRQRIHNRLEQDDDVQPQRLVLDVVEVIGGFRISDFELRISDFFRAGPIVRVA